MISHSPPIFSHSPPVSFLSEYMNNHRHQSINYNEEQNRVSRYCRPKVITLASKIMVNNASNVANSANYGNANNLNLNNFNNNSNNYKQINQLLNPNATIQKQQQRQLQQHQQQNLQQQNQRSYPFLNGNNLTATDKRINGLERMTSVPNFPLLPKSCLMRKKCQHKYVPKTVATPTDKTEPTTITTTESTSNTKNSDDVNDKNNSTGICEHCRSHKKVIFADDEGLALTEVRVMSEPSNVPPYWSMKFLEQITQGLVSPHPADQWTVDFKQPASDYLKFRQKIESNLVSLENVIVKDEESIVVGTVKVKNISFEKEVIVRVTWDDWRSQQDIFCTFARAYGPQTCANVVFDTFSFKITLPPSSKRLEFCICYRIKETEYWDNNNGLNYTITKRSPFYYNALSPYEKYNSSRSKNIMSTLSEALSNGNQTEQKMDNLQQDSGPYW